MTVLTRPRPAVAAGVAILAQAGISVLAHDKLHAKALVVDGKALVMTANFEACGLDTGFEVGALLSADATHGVEKTLREWANAFPWVYRFDATRGEHTGDFCTSTKGLRDGIIKVVQLRQQSAADVVAFDALNLDDAPEPSFAPTPIHNEIPQRVRFSWKVQVPHLPKGATERFQPVGRKIQGKDGKPEKKSKIAFVPPVYDHKNKAYVVLRTFEEAERARELATQLNATVVLQS